jgi:PAS domain S-box-containing protein
VEFEILRPDGSSVWVEANSASVQKTEGVVGRLLVLRDITERKRAESLLARSRDFHLSILQEFPAMIWRSGVDAKCDYFNKAWLSFTGRTLEQEIGSGWAEGVHPNDVDQCVAGYLKAFHAHEPFVLEYRLRRYDGEYQYILDRGSPFNDLDGNFAGFIGSCYDITERKQAEEERARLLKEVQDSNARLQHLSRRMLEVQEEERRRIARELHDQTGQSLTSLLVGLRVLEDLPTLGRAQTQASDLRKITMDALEEVKRLAMGLRPALLDDLGLEAALKRLVKESAQTYRVSMDLHIKGLTNRRLPPPVETGFYRIAQEALTNMGRHAAAKNVSVLLTCSESSVKLIIEDDGCGFDVEKALRLPGSSKHLGLLGMHERVSLLNGTISVESTPDSGTTIYVQLLLEARPS